jgi:hypothetical protein
MHTSVSPLKDSDKVTYLSVDYAATGVGSSKHMPRWTLVLVTNKAHGKHSITITTTYLQR